MILKLVNQKMKPIENLIKKDQGFRASVGLKMMVGVGLISILCTGLLIYFTFQVFSQIGRETQTLMDINTSMNKDLRNSIFDLQKKYLDIPKRLQVDSADKIQAWVKNNYRVEKEEIIEGRENYRRFFDRSQRRDLSNGNFVVQHKNGRVIISQGLADQNGDFLEKIKRIHLVTERAAADAEVIAAFVQNTIATADSASELKQKVMELKNVLADEAIAAEKSRNAILYQVEDMDRKKSNLISYRQDKQKTILVVTGVMILINLILLHFMAWFVVEKPLKRLARSLYKINMGEVTAIPYQERKDRIGFLAGALEKFQVVLARLRDEDLRKKAQKETIRELIQQMSGMIEIIQSKAQAMKKSAVELTDLAGDTEEQISTVSESAIRTVNQTDSVSSSTQQLQSAVQDIGRQVSMQTSLVEEINTVTRSSREDMEQLTRASDEINEIVSIVKNIAGQTKLLALNARIEAARSGEAGKGFTVVAREVRELSLKTEAANEDIANRIDAIQKASAIIIEYTRQTDEKIERLMETSQQISVAVEQQDAVSCGISENAHATADDIKDVSNRIGRVNDAAKVTSRFAGSVRTTSDHIEAQLSGLLKHTRDKLSKTGLTKTTGSPGSIQEHLSDDTDRDNTTAHKASITVRGQAHIGVDQSAA